MVGPWRLSPGRLSDRDPGPRNTNSVPPTSQGAEDATGRSSPGAPFTRPQVAILEGALLTTPLTIEQLWGNARFSPNPAQKQAILHSEGPLYITAGPGSGKTRVILWRTLNLLVFHNVPPDEICLTTFTEKAATQLREGLQALLGHVSNVTKRQFDLSAMYVGTMHSLCLRLLADRRFSPDRLRPRPPRLMDQLDQYFFLYRRRNWSDLLAMEGLDIEDNGSLIVNEVFGGSYDSRHEAATHCIALFNRLSEECIEPQIALEWLGEDVETQYFLNKHGIDPSGMAMLLRLYGHYRTMLATRENTPCADFALIQQAAYDALCEQPTSGSVFRHVIVDEYQDTNTIQERLFVKLAEGHRNLCVVGDDDQALYRFRGATVENFVEFPSRCRQHLGIEPNHVELSVNYRSRPPIVSYYRRFIDLCNWTRKDGQGQYRVAGKVLRPFRDDSGPAVVATRGGSPEDCFEEIADLVVRLLKAKRVTDPNQIAFLYPSLKTPQCTRAIAALEARGLKVYAPRAGKFLQVPEATDMLGLLAHIIGPGGLGGYHAAARGQYTQYRNWLSGAVERAQDLMAEDAHLAQYVSFRQEEIETTIADGKVLQQVLESHGWEQGDEYDPARMKRALGVAPGLSERARRQFARNSLDDAVSRFREQGHPMNLRYVVRRVTGLDWSLLDAFYQLCGMRHFRDAFDLAESGEDEGPACNLSLVSQYLRRYLDQYGAMLTADTLNDQMQMRLLFGSYCYALWRLEESEFEDPDNPFPKGRIPFLTIHQSKGLEFPVVVLGNPFKLDRGPQKTEVMVHRFVSREEGEPLDRMSEFDIMRMFYVSLSRPQNLLVLPRFVGRGQRCTKPFRQLFDSLPLVKDLDVAALPESRRADSDLPRAYSYTGDYLAYRRCPRQYMVYQRYGFDPARTQTQFFGSLVHRTLDDLHNFLIARREKSE